MIHDNIRENSVPAFISFVSLLREPNAGTEGGLSFDPSEDEIEGALSSVFPAPATPSSSGSLVVAA